MLVSNMLIRYIREWLKFGDPKTHGFRTRGASGKCKFTRGVGTVSGCAKCSVRIGINSEMYTSAKVKHFEYLQISPSLDSWGLSFSEDLPTIPAGEESAQLLGFSMLIFRRVLEPGDELLKPWVAAKVFQIVVRHQGTGILVSAMDGFL
jgi:hypothetical protein